MPKSIPKLSNEQRAALQAHPGGAIEVADDQTQQVYLLISKDEFYAWTDTELRRELQIGFDQADAGDVADWDVDEILAEAHRRRTARAP